jgi:hypothetical protein
LVGIVREGTTMEAAVQAHIEARRKLARARVEAKAVAMRARLAGTRLEREWGSDSLDPGTGAVAHSNAPGGFDLNDWPTPDEIARVLTTYNHAFLDADTTWSALPEVVRQGVGRPTRLSY